jgi:RNA-directed DNA polymerase
VRWLRGKHRRLGWKKVRARFLRYDGKTWVTDGVTELFDPAAVAVTRYRYRGDIPTPWEQRTDQPA